MSLSRTSQLALALFILALASTHVMAQRRPAQAELNPRFGLGFEALFVPPGQGEVQSGLGLGIRGRASLPVNADLSFAADFGFAGFLFSGRDDASYAVNPQASAILTIPRLGRTRYLMAGMGGYFPSTGGGGPTIHGGVGWVTPLTETSLFVEVNPALVIGRTRTSVVIPVRVGVIF
jgi:hypothetical protein